MKKLLIPFSSKSLYALEHFNNKNKNLLLCCSEEENAISAYKQLKFYGHDGITKRPVIYFPSLDTVPYDRVSPNSEILAKRASALTELAMNGEPKILVTAAQNLLQKIPPPEEFVDSTLSIKPEAKLDIEAIITFLIKAGFSRVASAVDSSEFAVRGEIVDLVTHANKGYRINFGWNQIESIREYDTYSQISTKSVDSLILSSATETLINSQTIINFKNNFLQLFGVNHIHSPMYESIISGQKFHGYEHLMPLFFKNMSTLYEFLGEHEIIYDNLCLQSMIEFENTYNDFYESRLLSNKSNPDSFYFAIPPSFLINSSQTIKERLSLDNCTLIEHGSSNDLTSIIDIAIQAKIENKTEFDKLFELIVENKKKIPIILCNSKSGKSRIKNIAETSDYATLEISKLSEAKKNIINLGIAPLSTGFMSSKYLFIAENDILGNKFVTQSHKSASKKLKSILTELDNIVEGEIVVHKEHGIGRFEKIQTIYVDNIAHDCLKIIYANNDILYLPVENIDQFKKYGGDEVVLDKLGSASWQKRKSKLKNRIKDIAAKLIKISAARQLATTAPTYFEQSAYDKFCKNFPYNETNDQISSIEDIKSDLESGKLMDRLICGDVGFGKTEVAMRATFMVSCSVNDDRPQVAIISPTTILCKQHFHNFLDRFKNMDLNIAQLSRFIKPSQAKKVKEGVERGEINIIIGTHALLAADIKFKNLKMIIIDEEQHFGVAQKEHLKQLKSNVHVLSLSATPIPRTLQMSMVGIKDLSLITTPPIDRLPVRTNVLPFDAVVIRDALMRERFRGGISFYVVPRIKDIEWVAKQLSVIVPELKFKIAHGQMAPSEVDNTMNEFCEAKFDILLSTTIIESGIDISIANTIIIHRSDMLGLSQLYQLRGRVGRGKVRGYAYLTLTHHKSTKHSLQRLDILQNIDSLGAGFTIASHDMDLRGFGNLVGDEQSGHIREVGAELYQEMLDEAINELKNDTANNSESFNPIINLGIAILIPDNYIEDSSLRLAIYRRTGDLKSSEEIENFRIEMEDRFGLIPKEFNNLLEMVKIRNMCFKLNVETFDSGPNGFVVKFRENLGVAEMVLSFINKFPRHAKIKPDNKLVFIKVLNQDALIRDAQEFLTNLML